MLLDIVKHPLFQRLTRIKQLGLTNVVYPGAQHTRFQHSLGAFHLTSEAILSLTQKGVFIFESEAEAVQAAILMHDIGHGPFSHVLENTLIHGISHEEISLMMMNEINHDLGDNLTLAIKIFKDEYPKRFLHQLISSQLDMDRLDYLRRDSFFTGVTEGNIGSARIIKMLNVDAEPLQHYKMLDDSDIWASVKAWTTHHDPILSLLSRNLIDRRIFKVEVRSTAVEEAEVMDIRHQIAQRYGLSFDDTAYLVNVSTIRKDMYDIHDDHISILYKDGTIKDITEASEILNISLLSKKICKYYLCYQRF